MKKWSPGAWISLAISTIAAFGIVSLVPVNGGSQWYMLMLYGAICIIAMILPGLSGSFLLLIFGQYQKVWNAVGNFAHFQWNMADFCTLLFLAAGALIGIASFVHLLNWLLKNFYNVTIAALIGFMIGAIPRLWPWQIEANNHFSCCAPATDITMLWTILCAGAGLLLVLAVEYFARNKTNEEYQ